MNRNLRLSVALALIDQARRCCRFKDNNKYFANVTGLPPYRLRLQRI